MLMAEMRDKGLPRKHRFAVTSQVVMLTFWEKWGLTEGWGTPGMWRDGNSSEPDVSWLPTTQTNPQNESLQL